jgi:hypothetical protein
MNRMERINRQLQRFDDWMTYSWGGNAIVIVLMALVFLAVYCLAP